MWYPWLLPCPCPWRCKIQHLRQHNRSQRRNRYDPNDHARRDGASFQARLYSTPCSCSLFWQSPQTSYRKPLWSWFWMGWSHTMATKRRRWFPGRCKVDARNGCGKLVEDCRFWWWTSGSSRGSKRWIEKHYGKYAEQEGCEQGMRNLFLSLPAFGKQNLYIVVVRFQYKIYNSHVLSFIAGWCERESRNLG